jgi:glucose/arabinose dehydrogenase
MRHGAQGASRIRLARSVAQAGLRGNRGQQQAKEGCDMRRPLATLGWALPAAGICLLGTVQAYAAADLLPSITKGSIAVRLDPVATGLGAPDYAISAPGDSSRLFVVEQKGTLRVLQKGSLLSAPALDIQSLVSPPLNPASANDERGFLGLAFHPGFNTPSSPGYRSLFTYTSEAIPAGTSPTYAAPNGALQNYRNVVSEWKMSATDPNLVDPTSRREIISFGKNAGNHNGGTIAFGNDGYLYLGLGDGGNANDVGPSHISPGGNAQNLSTPLGKMIRIDPIDPALNASSTDPISANGQYRIPTSNPFQGASQVPETFAMGFRNPYRFSFDAVTGRLIVADVGQNNVEEINDVVLGGNYGWAVKEGTFLFDMATGTVISNSPGSPAGLIDPISGALGTLEYDHQDGISITGGFVYRGSAIPQLIGKYVFGDLALQNLPPRVDGRLFYADLETGEIKELLLPQFASGTLPDGLTVHGFGQDASGELYALVTNTPSNGLGGIVFQIAAVPEPSTWALFGAGIAMVGFGVRRRRQQPLARR